MDATNSTVVQGTTKVIHIRERFFKKCLQVVDIGLPNNGKDIITIIISK